MTLYSIPLMNEEGRIIYCDKRHCHCNIALLKFMQSCVLYALWCCSLTALFHIAKVRAYMYNCEVIDGEDLCLYIMMISRVRDVCLVHGG